MLKILPYFIYGGIGGVVWVLVDSHRYGLAAGVFTAAVLMLMKKEEF